MAYIGQIPTGLYTTTNAKDTFSGDASATSFTLSQAGTTNNVDVFVENVRQEPTVAYVVDGNTLTFTAPPVSGTDNIYVVNRGPAELSASHPASQALEAYSGTFTTDLTVGGAFTSQGIDDNASSTAVTINSSGALMVNTTETGTAASPTVAGTGYFSTYGGSSAASFSAVSQGAIVGYLNRNTSDGTILDIRKDNNTVGSIGTSGGELYIDFGGSTGGNVSSRTLDDYEEGTWTPTIGSGTLTATNPRYVKIGKQVTVWGLLLDFSDRTSAVAVNIGGLPFTTDSLNLATSGTMHRYINAGGDSVQAYTFQSTNTLTFYACTKNASYTNVLHSQLSSTASVIFFTISYRAA